MENKREKPNGFLEGQSSFSLVYLVGLSFHLWFPLPLRPPRLFLLCAVGKGKGRETYYEKRASGQESTALFRETTDGKEVLQESIRLTSL